MVSKVALITEIISPYRIPVFNALSQYPGIDLTVLFCAETERKRAWEIPKEQMHFKYEVLPRILHRYQHPHGESEAYLNPSILHRLHHLNPDVIITGGYHQPTYWLAFSYARIFRKRILLWTESTSGDLRHSHPLKETIKRVLIRSYIGYIVPGSPQKEYLTKFGINSSLIWTAPNAVDVEYFATHSALTASDYVQLQQSLDIDVPVVLFVGRLVQSKGLSTLLQALHKVQRDIRVNLLVVGSGPEEAWFRHLAHELSVSTHFVGFAQAHDLARYYGLADILCFPSLADPWGLVINEAQACGLPVIASTAAGATLDLVIPGWNGLVHAPGNVDELAARLVHLLQDSSLRMIMGEHARQMSQRYTPSICAAGIAQAALHVQP